MATQLKSLKIDRVDLVPEGANSAAFVTLYKGKEGKPMEFEEILEKMKPEHAEILKSKLEEVEKAKAEAEAKLAEALEKAKESCHKADESDEEDPVEDEDEVDKADTKTEGTTSFDEDETLVKSLPPELQEYVSKIRQQKEAAEEVAKAAIARERHAEAVTKASELKALPVEQDTLISFIEKADGSTVDMLSAIAKGIESTVLTEVGSNDSGSFAKSASDAWGKIEAKAAEIAKAQNISKEKAVGLAVEQNPELYKEYLEGGAN